MDYDNPNAQEFADVMQAEQLVDLQKLKDLARRGVPFDVRGDVWMYLLGVLAADTSNEESLIRERLAEYNSLNKSNQKLEQTIRHECSRYYQRRLIAKMKPGRPKRPAVRTTEQPDREQAAAAELKLFTDTTESIICAYLNSKFASLSQRERKQPAPGRVSQQSPTDLQTGPGWDARSASVPTRPGSRATSDVGTTNAHDSTAGSWTGSAVGSASDYGLSDSGRSTHRPGVVSSSSSSEEGHVRKSTSGAPTQQTQQHVRYSSDFETFSPETGRGWMPSNISEPSDGEEPPPLQRLPSSFSDRPTDHNSVSDSANTDDELETSSYGNRTASLVAIRSLPSAFQPSSTNPNPHVHVLPDIQPEFHPALVSLCAPFVECIKNETGMYFSFARLMQMLEEYNTQYPLTERVSTFLTLFRITLPELHAYFEEEEVDIVGFATRWLQDLLSAEMRIGDVMRLWDAYFAQLEPLELHLYVCVAILMVLKDQLEELDHSECKSMLNALPDLDIELIVNEAINIRLSQQQSFNDDE